MENLTIIGIFIGIVLGLVSCHLFSIVTYKTVNFQVLPVFGLISTCCFSLTVQAGIAVITIVILILCRARESRAEADNEAQPRAHFADKNKVFFLQLSNQPTSSTDSGTRSRYEARLSLFAVANSEISGTQDADVSELTTASG